MYMLSRKDLHSAELETVRASRNPTRVITANGEVQTNEEATVYVYDKKFIRDNTNPRGYASSFFFEDHGYSHEWTTGQKTTSY